MGKIKITEEEISKLTLSEKKSLDTLTGFMGIITLLSSIGIAITGVLSIAYFIWNNNLTLFLAVSSGFLELLILIVFYSTYKNGKKKVKELKDKVIAR